MGNTPMVGVFDTSFYATLEPKAYVYALPSTSGLSSTASAATASTAPLTAMFLPRRHALWASRWSS